MDSAKKKIKNCSNGRKIQIRSPVPEYWTIQKIKHFLKVSEHALRQARKLKKEGILVTPGRYSKEGLRKGTERRVVSR